MSGDLSEEIKQLAEKYKNSPESRVFAPLADAYRKSGLVDKSIEICEDGLNRYPEYASAHVILGKCFYDKGATERSKGEFERVLEIDSENMVALKFLGDILLGEDKKDEAAEFYRRLLAIDPTNEGVSKSLEEMNKDFKSKEIDLGDKKRIKKNKQPRELATMTLAGIYASQGYYAKALSMYEDICENGECSEEAAAMVKKLRTMIDQTEGERNEAFGEEVLTISIDDVSSELARNTSGHGGDTEDDIEDDPSIETKSKAEKLDEEYAEDSEMEEIAAQLEKSDEDRSDDEEGVTEDEGAEPESETEEDIAPEKGKENKNHFQDWLKKMNDKRDKN
ncbi:MAG: tetratricopeptide repeat protein [Candidatus Krumholzibacteriota bacterium]|nr:tetratricopeptide repeat protein [Candidatus Krumholzibacteriota bacterium]